MLALQSRGTGSGRLRAFSVVLSLAAVAAGFLDAPAAAGSVIPKGNIVKNPGFERGDASAGETVVPIEGWTTLGTATAMSYDEAEDHGYPGPRFAELGGGGANFFAGSPSQGTPRASAFQDHVLPKELWRHNDKSGGLPLYVSAHLGGYGSQDDRVFMRVVARDRDHETVGAFTLEGPTAAQRQDETKFRHIQAQWTVPVGTRHLFIGLLSERANTDLVNTSANDGYADNIWVSFRRQNETRGILLEETTINGQPKIQATVGPESTCCQDLDLGLYRVRDGRDRRIEVLDTVGRVAYFDRPSGPGRYYVGSRDERPVRSRIFSGN